MSDVARFIDPETCNHNWWLVLYMTGRRVALECGECKITDMQVWGPGGIADLVTYEVDTYLAGPPDTYEVIEGKIIVANGQHNADRQEAFAVDLSVSQSTSIMGYRSGGEVAKVNVATEIKVNVTPRWYHS